MWKITSIVLLTSLLFGCAQRIDGHRVTTYDSYNKNSLYRNCSTCCYDYAERYHYPLGSDY